MDLKKISVYFQAGFYLFAGVNHFINPEFYYPLIPEYFVFPKAINSFAGFAEILLGGLLFFNLSRKFAAYMIIIMLLSFVVSHWYFIQLGSCIENILCVPEWIGWGRLLVIHPLLIYWAWSVRNSKFYTVEEKTLDQVFDNRIKK